MEDTAFIPLADLVVLGKMLGIEAFFQTIFLSNSSLIIVPFFFLPLFLFYFEANWSLYIYIYFLS